MRRHNASSRGNASQGAMRRQGMCRHNASSGGNASQGAMRRQGMCRRNASSTGPGSSPMCRCNASSASAPKVIPKLRASCVCVYVCMYE